MHNYLKKLNDGIAKGFQAPAGLSDLKIEHDNWCLIFRGGECNCDPTLTLTSGLSLDEHVRLIMESAKEFNATVKAKQS